TGSRGRCPRQWTGSRGRCPRQWKNSGRNAAARELPMSVDRDAGLAIWTIGHSTRGIDEFLGLLPALSIGLVTDVRMSPGSNRFLHFSVEVLKNSLGAVGITYHHYSEFGGRREKRPRLGQDGLAGRRLQLARRSHGKPRVPHGDRGPDGKSEEL